MSFRGYKRATVDKSTSQVYEGALMACATPQLIDGVPFFPASEMSYGRSLDYASGDMAVSINMWSHTALGNQLGLFVKLTPDAARIMAAALIKQAALVEAHVADQASAAIAAARQRPTSGESA
ncbi:MAG: hypothetical protein ACK4IS_13250 [Erythrobacter sp.]